MSFHWLGEWVRGSRQGWAGVTPHGVAGRCPGSPPRAPCPVPPCSPGGGASVGPPASQEGHGSLFQGGLQGTWRPHEDLADEWDCAWPVRQERRGVSTHSVLC